MRVALVHDWLEHYAGSERVFEQLLLMYPEADLFAVVDFVPKEERGFLQGRPVKTTFIQRLPFARRYFRHFIGLMPLAIEQLDMSGYDLIISSSHSVAKGVITGPNQVHVSYVHSPMRYAWDLQAQYLREGNLERGLKGLYARLLLHRLRGWDARTALGVDVFVANSNYIADRVRKVYRREAVTVPPPVAVNEFVPGYGLREAYLVASRFVPYKRVELIVEAFAQMPKRHLIVVGSGPGLQRVLNAARRCANIEIRPPVPKAELVRLMQSARAFVFAAEEDFGITLVEAQACGTPVITFGAGGARDIVIDDTEAATAPTGILFRHQTAASVTEAVERFEAHQERFGAASCQQNAARFSTMAFRASIERVVRNATAHHENRRAGARPGALQKPIAA
ncbi:glycosyltransferase [Lichenicoccus sp.]|uniref:glycosyltransferase n=1 Tax=Lichenicoccus sp. TaxID=2781899 RepID=UPI003D0E457D